MTPEDDLFSKLRDAEAVRPTAPSEGSMAEKEILRGDPSVGAPVTLRTLFTHHDSHPVVLALALIKVFGAHWFEWEIETVWQEVRRIFKTEISEHARVKIQTIKTLYASDLPWQTWQVFEKIVQGLNNNIPRWEVMQAPTIEQLYVAVDIMKELREAPFGDEVRRYIAASMLHDEVCFAPPPLDFVQTEITHPVLVCLDCGNRESDYHDDMICSVCSRRYSPEQGLSFEPHPDEMGKVGDNGKKKGTHTQVEPTYDDAPARARWEQIGHMSLEEAPIEETNADIQVWKLLIARDYMNVRRRQLVEQLTSLKSWLGTA
jgi:hypothetical protein